MPQKILTCYHSPMIKAPEKMSAYLDYSNSTTFVSIYKSESTGEHFFYAECDPGLLYPYIWWKCSPGKMYIADNYELHFDTKSGSHYTFKIGTNWDELKEYIDSIS